MHFMFVHKLKYFHDLKYFCENILQSTLEVNQISRESKLIFQRQLGSMRAPALIVQQGDQGEEQRLPLPLITSHHISLV